MKRISAVILKIKIHLAFGCLNNNWIILAIILLQVISACSNDENAHNPKLENKAPRVHESFIIYTDVEPDIVSNDSIKIFNLDLNNDAIADFVLESLNQDVVIYMESNPYDTNRIATVAGPFEPYIKPLVENSVIGHPEQYFDTLGIVVFGSCEWNPTGCPFDWKEVQDRYIGLRFIINGSTHYGWARLNVENHSKWTLKDYAFNSIPDKIILSGQTE